MEPKLVATQKEVEEMIITLEADKKTAAETKACVRLVAGHRVMSHGPPNLPTRMLCPHLCLRSASCAR